MHTRHRSVGMLSRRTLLALSIVSGLACRVEESPPDPAHPSVLAGRWIQMYPAIGALDTLTLYEDGRVSGSVAGIGDDLPVPTNYWRIGHRLMPGGFCIGEERPPLTRPTPQRHCQGYRLVGDTLWLANGNRTTFLRLPDTGPLLALTPWTSPRGSVDAPVTGDSVPRPPASVRVR